MTRGLGHLINMELERYNVSGGLVSTIGRCEKERESLGRSQPKTSNKALKPLVQLAVLLRPSPSLIFDV